MVCDFLCQPDAPVPEHLAQTARDRLVSCLPLPGLGQRIELLLPVYRVKWACICLNEFSSAAERRRRFAGVLGESEKAVQLNKARELLDKVSS
jgi:hypothetical protein